MTARPLFLLSSLLLLGSLTHCEKKPLATPLIEETPLPATKNIAATPSLDASLPHFSGQNALYHASQICQFVPRHVESQGLEKSRLYLEKELQSYGWSTERQNFKAQTPQGEKKFSNLRARFSPQAKASFDTARSGILSGHIDTKLMDAPFMGANDGASHSGVLLEIARYLAKQKPQQASQIELVFFDGEEALGKYMIPAEDGLYGSLYYVEHAPLPRWMINLDMVGHSLLKIRIPADTHPSLYAHFIRARQELQASESQFDVASSSILDDHLPFQEKGIPALNLIGDFQDNQWWHTPQDTLEILSPKSLQKTGDFTLQLLNNLIP